jgi:hypothetical protein
VHVIPKNKLKTVQLGMTGMWPMVCGKQQRRLLPITAHRLT